MYVSMNNISELQLLTAILIKNLFWEFHVLLYKQSTVLICILKIIQMTKAVETID